MKKLFIILLCFIFVIPCISGCGHTHEYLEVVDEEFLLEEATLNSPAVYSKSCSCGSKSKETFTYGEPLEYKLLDGYEEKDARGMVDIVGLEFVSLLIPSKATFRKYEYHYKSVDTDGSEIILSSALIVPFKGGKPWIWGTIINNHPTLDDKLLAPTACWDMFSVTSISGCAVIECDSMGFGASVDKITCYHCKHLSARNTADGVLAAFSILKEEFSFDATNHDIYNVGYSQGGYDAMAFLRYMETEASEEEKEAISITKTFAGSGAYDVGIMFEEALVAKDFVNPEFAIMAMLSSKERHPEAFLTLTYDDYLTEYGKELVDAVLLKNRTELNIVKDELGEDGNPKYTGLTSVFKDIFFDKESDCYKALQNVNGEEGLIDGSWLPSGEVYMYYTEADKMVSPRCSVAALELFKGLENVTFDKEDFSKNVSHEDGGVTFYTNFLFEIIIKRPS